MDYDYEELACVLCGLNYDEVCDRGNEWDEIDNALYEKFGIDFETFENIADSLIEYTPVVLTEITKTPVHGFAVKEGESLYRFVVKKEVKK